MYRGILYIKAIVVYITYVFFTFPEEKELIMSEIEIDSPYDIPVIRKLLSCFEPEPNRLKGLAELAGLSHHAYPSLSRLCRQLPKPMKGQPKQIDWDVHIDVYHEGPWSYTHPVKFRIGSWVCTCPKQHWADVLRNACEILAIEHPDEFFGIAKHYKRPTSKPLFSEDRKELSGNSHYISRVLAHSSSGIGGADSRTGIYVEMNLSANNVYRFIDSLARSFGYEGLDVYPRSSKVQLVNRHC